VLLRVCDGRVSGAQLVKQRPGGRRAVQSDPRAHRLAARVEGHAGELSAWELANVSSAEAELGLCSPGLLDAVRGPVSSRGSAPVSPGDLRERVRSRSSA